MRVHPQPCHGAAILAYIKEHGIPAVQICDKTGIKQGRLSECLHDKKKLTLEEYELLCAALAVPLGTFLQERKLK